MTAIAKRWFIWPGQSSDQVANDPAMHIRQAKVAAGISIRESFVIETHQVQHGGMQIMNVDLVLDGLEAELVCSSMDLAAFDSAAGQPH